MSIPIEHHVEESGSPVGQAAVDLLDEDDTPPEVIERMDREWERRQASKLRMVNSLDFI